MKKQTSGNSATGGKANRLAGVLGLLLALSLIAGSAGAAYALEPPPQIPFHLFSGTVTLHGRAAPAETLVEAYVDGVKKAEARVGGNSRYTLAVEGPGTTVTFYVDGILANETATWAMGQIDAINLTAGEARWGICFIATAAFGGPTARQVEIMVQFWHQYILTNPLGHGLAYIYDRVGPPVAGLIYDQAYLKPVARAVLSPLVILSTIGVNTTVTWNAVAVGLLALVLVALAAWATGRRGRRPEHTRA